MVGIDSSTAKNAENVLQDTTLEKSYHLTPENLQLLGSRLWRDFQTSVAPQQALYEQVVKKFRMNVKIR